MRSKFFRSVNRHFWPRPIRYGVIRTESSASLFPQQSGPFNRLRGIIPSFVLVQRELDKSDLGSSYSRISMPRNEKIATTSWKCAPGPEVLKGSGGYRPMIVYVGPVHHQNAVRFKMKSAGCCDVHALLVRNHQRTSRLIWSSSSRMCQVSGNLLQGHGLLYEVLDLPIDFVEGLSESRWKCCRCFVEGGECRSEDTGLQTLEQTCNLPSVRG